MDSMNNQNALDPEVQGVLDPNPQHLSENDPNIAKDPVCGMLVDKRTAKFTISKVANEDVGPYYFCSATCKTVFEEDPHKYGADF